MTTKPKPIYTWQYQVAKGEPHYEVSSKGDRRFSAYFARLSNGFPIEHVYQTVLKGYSSIATGKGNPPKNPRYKDNLYDAYKELWALYLDNNPQLEAELRILAADRPLTDMFSINSPINQAHALCDLLNERPDAMTSPWPVIPTTESGVLAAESEALTTESEAPQSVFYKISIRKKQFMNNPRCKLLAQEDVIPEGSGTHGTLQINGHTYVFTSVYCGRYFDISVELGPLQESLVRDIHELGLKHTLKVVPSLTPVSLSPSYEELKAKIVELTTKNENLISTNEALKTQIKDMIAIAAATRLTLERLIANL